jgi:hypothetical protein
MNGFNGAQLMDGSHPRAKRWNLLFSLRLIHRARCAILSQAPTLHLLIGLTFFTLGMSWRNRDWSFHVPFPDGEEISGAVQADQLRSATREQRGSRFTCKSPGGDT